MKTKTNITLYRTLLFVAAFMFAAISAAIVYIITDASITTITPIGMIVGAILALAGLLSGCLCMCATNLADSRRKPPLRCGEDVTAKT